MKYLFLLLISIPTLLYSQIKTNKIARIVSSYGKDEGKTRPGFEMDEFSQAYFIFKTNGYEIDVASPKGGKVEADKFSKDKPYNKALLLDVQAMTLLNNTKATATLQAKDYDAVYIVGGKGPMFDLVVDPSLQDFILELDKKKAIISTVCHGSIALANIKKDTKYLVENKTITGYCNEEETLFGKPDADYPFLLEDRLFLRGAKFQKGQFMLPFMVKDENYVSGQNPYSVTLVAEEIIKSLGKSPVARTKYKDELSMELIKRAVLGDIVYAKEELKQNASQYDLQLIGIYGYYQAMFAKENIDKITKAIEIMELVTPYYFNENLYFPLSDYYVKLGNKEKAVETLNEILKKNPNSQKAESLLKKLNE